MTIKHIKHRFLFICIALLGISLTACNDSDDDDQSNTVTYDVVLSAAQNIPSNSSTATAQASFTLDKDTGALTGSVVVNDLSDATMSHIHTGFAGSNGSAVVTLEANNDNTIFSVPDNTMLNSNQMDALLEGMYYVNVHSPTNPSGEIRGQILPPTIKTYWINLSGEQEVPAITTNASAIAAITLNTTSGALYGTVTVSDLSDTSNAHIHTGFAGSNGSVVVALEPNDNSSVFSVSTDTTLDNSQMDALMKGMYYINVHSTTNPSGEIRGQILPGSINVYWFNLSGDQEVPAVTTTASGNGAITVNNLTGDLYGSIMTTGVEDASMAHIHTGVSGVNGGPVITLVQDSTDLNLWKIPDDANISTALSTFLSGGHYVNVHTPAYSGGEIRGQIE